jgi:hypothetical protein
MHLHKNSDPLLSTLLKHLWQRFQPLVFLGYDAISLAHLYLGSFSHSSLQILSSSVRLEGERRWTAIFRSLHRFRSGSIPGSGWATQGHSEACPEAIAALSWLWA